MAKFNGKSPNTADNFIFPNEDRIHSEMQKDEELTAPNIKEL
jgi:hypothetical protein